VVEALPPILTNVPIAGDLLSTMTALVAFGIISVFAVGSDTIMIDQFKEGDHHSAEFSFQFSVMKETAAHTREPFKEVAVGDGPFPAAFTAEDAEQVPGVV